MNSIIRIQNITKRYGKNLVLDSVSLDIQKGSILGLIGENGAGKTTLMKSLLGLIKIDAGEIYIENHSIKTGYNKAVKNVGFLLEPTFYDYLTAYKNMKANVLMKSAFTKEKAEEINKILKFVGLSKVKNKKVDTFSFGMKQRLGLAQALIDSPSILVLDEPLVGMDPVGMKSFKEKIIELNKINNTTIIFSSHQLEAVKDLCREIAVISNHRVNYYQKIEHAISNIFTFEFERELSEIEIENIAKVEEKYQVANNKVTIRSTENEIFSKIAAAVKGNIIINYYKTEEDLNKFFMTNND